MDWQEQNLRMSEQEARWAKHLLFPGAAVMAASSLIAAFLGLEPVNLFFALSAVLTGLGVAAIIR